MARARRWFPLAISLAVVLAAVLLIAVAPDPARSLLAPGAQAANDPRLRGAYRFEQGGWIYVHLEGAPAQLGFQHGYLLAREIGDAYKAVRLDSTHRTKRDWNFFRATARNVLWPHIDAEYQEELRGIIEGMKARGVAMDLDDLVALNAFEEVPDYYVPWLNKKEKVANLSLIHI